jgi:hypothetical protein
LERCGGKPYLRIWSNNSGKARAFKGGGVINFGLPGSHDIIGFTKGGLFIGIECKAGRDKLRDTQIRFHAVAHKFGVEHSYIISCPNLLPSTTNEDGLKIIKEELDKFEKMIDEKFLTP